MSGANPIDHVRDVPYFAITSDYGIVFPKKADEHATVDWGSKEILGASKGMPVVFTVSSVSLLFVTLLLLVSAFLAVKNIKPRPGSRPRLAQIFEVLVDFLLREVIRPNLGHHASKYGSMFISFFFFILFCNMWGMVPTGGWLSTATGNINITAPLAVIVLVSMFALGIREQGFLHFCKNYMPPGVPIFVWPILLPLELLGPFIKCFALAVRLFANMMAGHAVLAAIAAFAISGHDLNVWAAAPVWAASVLVSILEVFVALLQAYVFTMLSSLFVGMFLNPQH